MLSARAQKIEKVAALDAGADDFITKPFDIAELLARTRANLRRAQGSCADAQAVCRFGNVEIDLAARVVEKKWRGGSPDAD